MRIKFFGLENSRKYLSFLFVNDFLNQGQCHTLGHEIGRLSVSSIKGLTEAMDDANSLCGWAVFHGMMEGLFGKDAGHGQMTEDAYKMCSAISETEDIAVYNCFHALGHGFYFIDSQLLKALNRCDQAENDEKRNFCQDGVFMAHYFDIGEPGDISSWVSLCGTLEDKFMKYCYWRYVPVGMFKNNFELPASDLVFKASSEVPPKFNLVFWNGFGRELDSRTASNPEIIRKICGLGDGRQKSACIKGSAWHMVFYDRGNSERAQIFCNESGEATCSLLTDSGLFPRVSEL